MRAEGGGGRGAVGLRTIVHNEVPVHVKEHHDAHEFFTTLQVRGGRW